MKKSERQDLNLRPLPPQGSTLPSCATSRFNYFNRKTYVLLEHATPLRKSCRTFSRLEFAPRSRNFAFMPNGIVGSIRSLSGLHFVSSVRKFARQSATSRFKLLHLQDCNLVATLPTPTNLILNQICGSLPRPDLFFQCACNLIIPPKYFLQVFFKNFIILFKLNAIMS